MRLRLTGSPEFLNDPSYEAEILIDSWIPPDVLWIMPPTFAIYKDGLFRETIKVLTYPSNQDYAQILVERHNELYNSPLAKALREED